MSSSTPNAKSSVTRTGRVCKSRSASWVWEYFVKSENQGKITCTVCVSQKHPKPAKYADSCGTSTLSRHLRVAHKITPPSLGPEHESQKKIMNDFSLSLPNPLPDHVRKELLKSLVNFIVDYKLPFSAVKTRRLFSYVAN